MILSSLSIHEITQANKFIYNMYVKFGQGMNEDEFRDNSWVAYMEARKRYSYELTSTQYWLDVEKVMWEKIAEQKEYKSRMYRINAKLSLDQTWWEYKESVGTLLFPAQGNFVNGIVFWDYVNRLDNKKAKVIRLITEREDDYDIMEQLHMSLDEYYKLKLEIKEDMREYFEF